MGNLRLIVITDNQDFQTEAQDYLGEKDHSAEYFPIPAPMRAPGVIGMLSPTHVALDLSLIGADSFLNEIQNAAEKMNAKLLFFSTRTYTNGDKIAAARNAIWCPALKADSFVTWLLNGCKPVEVAASVPTSMPSPAQPTVQNGPVAASANPAEPDSRKPESTQARVAPQQQQPAAPHSASPEASDYKMLESPGLSKSGERLPSMDELLIHMLDADGSDLHLSVGSAPRMRVNGELAEIPGMPKLLGDDTSRIILPIIGDNRLEEYKETFEADFSYSIPGRSRFRVNVFRQRGAMGAVLRTIPFGIPTIEQLGLPEVCTELADKPRGLVLVTGPTGSGKSTTLAAMVNYINENKAVHIMTMEDPIEFMHRNKKALVNQREIGEDTESFAAALKHVLRQDPDVILVGELRDLETISAAITAAETGHLVFGTLHTIGGPETIDRIIDVFPPEQQNQIRMQLSGSLQGVLSQVLCPLAEGKGRALAQEIMLGVPAIGNLIREGKTHQMESIIQSSGALGMTTLDHSLRKLVDEKRITPETAVEKAKDPKTMGEVLGFKF